MVPELSSSGAPLTYVDVLVSYYETASAKLKAIVLHPPGGNAKAQAFNQARAGQQLLQIDQILVGLRKDAAKWVGEVIPLAARDGQQRAIKQATEIFAKTESERVAPNGPARSDSVVRPSFNLVDSRTVEVLARDTYADLNKAATSIADRASKVLRSTRQQGLNESEINKILAGGVIEGKPTETIRNLRESLRAVHGDEVQIIDKNGNPINFQVGYYAEMVARTKTRQASVTARHEQLQREGLNLVSIIGRVSKNFCTTYLGEVFSLDGKSDKYPPLTSLPSGGPPFHPNCSKSTRPFLEELASEKQLTLAEGDEESDKFLNIDAATAQRRFKDLQRHQTVSARYGKTG